MKMITIVLILSVSAVLTLPGVARAQKLPNAISYGTVIGNLTIDTIQSYKSDERADAFKKQAIRTGIVLGSSEILKRLVKKERPDHSDNKSFPSMHSALSCVSVNTRSGKGFSFEFPIAFGTMAGRKLAKKHDWIDTSTGCLIGILAGSIR